METEQLALSDDMDIDYKATANEVRKFLKFRFDKYLDYAGLNSADLSAIDESHLSSPKMDASGVSSHGGVNHMEQALIRITVAENVCYVVYKTIKSCRQEDKKPYRKILEEAYLNHTDDLRIQAMISYSSTRYDILKRRALLEFADRVWVYKVKRHLDDEDIPVFYVYKKRAIKGLEEGKNGDATGL